MWSRFVWCSRIKTKRLGFCPASRFPDWARPRGRRARRFSACLAVSTAAQQQPIVEPRSTLSLNLRLASPSPTLLSTYYPAAATALKLDATYSTFTCSHQLVTSIPAYSARCTHRTCVAPFRACQHTQYRDFDAYIRLEPRYTDGDLTPMDSNPTAFMMR